eukprot:TRINITY_DN74896_c0_g1_i1.p1 TRINITY_DN74896_c0_g1~~TRINITY_DN74896_c0_g1_i1.p1  ORF type:complete len:174 (-),score=25.26 TRINITY_DN74896_c0_g1_i1:374-844(-)
MEATVAAELTNALHASAPPATDSDAGLDRGCSRARLRELASMATLVLAALVGVGFLFVSITAIEEDIEILASLGPLVLVIFVTAALCICWGCEGISCQRISGLGRNLRRRVPTWAAVEEQLLETPARRPVLSRGLRQQQNREPAPEPEEELELRGP